MDFDELSSSAWTAVSLLFSANPPCFRRVTGLSCIVATAAPQSTNPIPLALLPLPMSYQPLTLLRAVPSFRSAAPQTRKTGSAHRRLTLLPRFLCPTSNLVGPDSLGVSLAQSPLPSPLRSRINLGLSEMLVGAQITAVTGQSGAWAAFTLSVVPDPNQSLIYTRVGMSPLSFAVVCLPSHPCSR